MVRRRFRLRPPAVAARDPRADHAAPRLAENRRAAAGERPAAAAEQVCSAPISRVGIGQLCGGDRINNGALDNAAGASALLDIAAELRRTRARPKRSLLFVFVTAEEKGLLGARYFSRRPTVPRQSIVADLNYDMALPLYPLRSIIVIGAEESSIGADAAAAAQAIGIPLVPDPFPNRNSFTRSDQYAFIEQGIPAVAFKFGFAAGAPEAETERFWRATHYHSPSTTASAGLRDD